MDVTRHAHALCLRGFRGPRCQLAFRALELAADNGSHRRDADRLAQLGL
jgi:hypothetical protein